MPDRAVDRDLAQFRQSSLGLAGGDLDAGPGEREAVGGGAPGPSGGPVMIWLQVRDVRAEHGRLAAAGVRVLREPVAEPWGLTEMWIEDPDGVAIVLVEVPAGHPLRRDPR